MEIRGTCIASITDEHGPIYVYETKKIRILSFDGEIYQSSMKLNNINGLTLAYTQAMMAALLFIPNLKVASIMGLGSGSMVKNLLHSFPAVKVHAVEYRKAVADIARNYFSLPDTDRLSVHINDAIRYMHDPVEKSDVIFSDLYSSEGMEPKQVQADYLSNCKNNLNEHGLLVLNVCHTTDKLQKDFDRLLINEFENSVLSFTIEGNNKIVFAFKGKVPPIEANDLLIKAQSLQEKNGVAITRYVELLLLND